VWNHYRRHGNLTKWFTDRYRNRIDQYQREDAAPDAENLDADAIAWQEHVRELRLKDPPGGPPSADR